jgi:RNA-directed DNA polymerase
VRGWINYYGRYYPSMLYPTLRNLNRYLVRWARRKYRRLKIHDRRARQFLADVARREPNLFAHWRFGVKPDGWARGAG